MVRECKTRLPKPRSFFSVGCRYRAMFLVFKGLQEKLFGVNLAVPVLNADSYTERLSELKSFCGGMIEGKVHLWRAPCKRLSSSSRMSIAMSLFLFRKVLPSLEPDLQAYVDKMSTVGVAPDVSFLEYCQKKVEKMFPMGWDSGRYETCALNATIPMKSCVQSSQAQGGARSFLLNRHEGWNSHHDYVLEVLSRESKFNLVPSRIAAVETGGKYRIVSVGDAEMNLFRPLHTAIYNHISQKKWLLRGDAVPSRFDEFVRVPGEQFASGDYESATDNLSQRVSMCLLQGILSRCTSVPAGIRESAPQMLETSFFIRGGPVYQQARGQLMGNLLSFPLLCIVNYLAFRFYSGTVPPGNPGVQAPVKVNGDDIVFRASPEVIRRWTEGVRGSGLVLSKGKTMVNGTFFSLNSTLFRALPRRVTLVPMIRSTAFGFRKDCGGVETLSGRWGSFAPGFRGARRSYARVAFLRWNAKWIFASRRSCSRGLGIFPSRDDLMKATLWDRECYYLSFEDGIEKPIPLKPSFLEQERKPPGWELRRVEKITKEMRELQKEIGPAFVAAAWSPLTVGTSRDVQKEWMASISHTGISYPIRGLRDRMKKKARLLGLSPRNARRFLSPSLSWGQYERHAVSGRRKVWLPIGWRSRLTELGNRKEEDGFPKSSSEFQGYPRNQVVGETRREPSVNSLWERPVNFRVSQSARGGQPTRVGVQ